MQIKVKGQPDRTPGPGSTLGSVLAELRRHAGSRRQVVGAINLDGAPLTGEQEREFEGRPASDFDRLEAEVAAPEEMVRQVYAGLVGALAEIAGQAQEAARELRAGGPPRAPVVRVAEGLAFVVDAYQDGARLLAATRRGWPIASPSAEALEGALNEFLAAVYLSDAVRLGDALEHELTPALRALEAEIGERIAALAALDGAAATECEPRGEQARLRP